MIKKVKFAIIGAGTVGLTALGKIRRETDDFVMIQDGPYGTTCARVGCMPSKALIHAANHFHHATHSENFGVRGGEKLTVDHAFVMERVRRFRDRFTGGIQKSTTDTLKEDQLIEGRANFIGKNLIEVNGQQIEAERIIIGTGSRPTVPQAWRKALGDRLITSDHFFDLETLPKSVAVIGLGVIGLELGQALARLGVQVTGFEATDRLGGLLTPQANSVARSIFQESFPILLGQAVDVKTEGEQAVVVCGTECVYVDKVLVSIGRTPNLDDIGMENLGVALDEYGMPPFDPETMQIADLPVFIAGDVANYRPILHEAGDEGRIARDNAISFPEITRVKRKTPLGVTFSEPGLAFFGERYPQLDLDKTAVAEFNLERNNGRAIVMDEDHGVIVLFADKESGRLIGGELVMSQAEHMAHLLNWVTALELTVDQILALPFYHPVLEEAVESALRALQVELRAS